MIDIQLGCQEELFNTIKDNSIDSIITDPPYGLSWNHKIETKIDFNKFIENSYRVLKDNGFLIYFGQEPTMSNWNVITQEKFKYITEIIWYKRNHSSAFQYPLRVHEKIIIYTKNNGKLNKANIDWLQEKNELKEYSSNSNLLRIIEGIKKTIKESNSIEELKTNINEKITFNNKHNDVAHCNSYGTRQTEIYKLLNGKKLSTLWSCIPHNKQQFNKAEFNIKHPTVKPIQILQRLLEMSSNENDTILDPFLGSGTTALACKNMNRNCIGFELDKDYYDIAKQRLNDIFI